MKILKYLFAFLFVSCSLLAGTVTDTNNNYVFKDVSITNSLSVSNRVCIGMAIPDAALGINGSMRITNQIEQLAANVTNNFMAGTNYMSGRLGVGTNLPI